MSGRCERCGYDRRGLAEESPCPECGESAPDDRFTVEGCRPLHAAPMRVAFTLGEMVFAFMALFGLLELARGGWAASGVALVVIGGFGAILLEWTRRIALARVTQLVEAGACEQVVADRSGVRITLNAAELRFGWSEITSIAARPSPDGGQVIVVKAGQDLGDGSDEFELAAALSPDEAQAAVESLLARRPAPPA